MKRGLIVVALVAATASLTCCRGQEKVQVAFIGSVSGKLTGNTILGMNAIELYLNRPQSAESWAGYELVIFDDKSDEDNLAGIVSEIKKRGIKFVIGPFSSSFAMRARELLAGADILLVAPVAAADDLAGIDDNFIKLYPSITAAAERLAEQAAASGARKIAPIQDVSNLAFCTIWVRAFRDILAGRVEVAEPISFRNPGAIDYNRLSSSALSTGADSVLLIANTFD